MKKILITDLIPESVIERLEEHFIVDVNRSNKSLSKNEMLTSFKNYDGILSMFTNTIDKEILDTLEHTEIIANYAVGHNNIDSEFAKSKNIIVTNTPDVLSDTTAETAWALLYSVARRIVEADKFLRDGKWGKFTYDFMAGQDIYNKTLGVIGAGRIGKKFAEKAKGYNMRILYYNRNRDIDFEEDTHAEYVTLEELMVESDFVSVHVPLTEETQHMLDYELMSKMKSNAILVNTARGPVIKEEDLIKILQEKKIYGAGLDVFEFEPHVPEELLKMDNVVLLPHIGSSSMETRTAMAELAANNLIAVLNGESPITPVNV